MTRHKVDFKKVYQQLYTAGSDPVMVDVPELPFLMADGAGDPATAGFRAAVEALYGVAFAIRFALKKAVTPWSTRSCRCKGCGGLRMDGR